MKKRLSAIMATLTHSILLAIISDGFMHKEGCFDVGCVAQCIQNIRE